MQPFGDSVSARNATIVRLVAALAAGQYEEVMRLAPRSRVSAQELQAEVEQYGRTLCPLPEQAQVLIDYVAIRQTQPPAWSVVVPLFTNEEGRSDLSFELTMVEVGEGEYEAQVDGLHVL